MRKNKFLIGILSAASLVIGALGLSACELPSAHFHQYGEGEITTEATCGNAGVKTFTCDCGDSYTEEIPALAHEIEQVEGKESTCSEHGYEAYEYCKNCDYTTKGEELPLKAHATITHEAQESTCTEQGWNTYETCENCEYSTKEENMLPLAAHAEITHEAQASTCIAQGWNEYVTCENCEYTTKELLPLGDHARVKNAAQESSCTEQGWNEYDTCELCEYSTKEENMLPLKAHAEITHEAQESTCTEQGWNAYVTCENCAYSTKEENMLPLKAHATITHQAQESTCTEQGWNAYETCENCEYSTKEENMLPLQEHDFADGVCGVCGGEDPEYTASVGLLYELNTDGTAYTVAGLGTCVDSNIVIPSTYQEKPVTAIKKKAFEKKAITSVEIPDSVTTIGESAFYDCSQLVKVVLPNGLKTIAKSTFHRCIKLSDITIPDSVRGIGDSAFYDCDALTVIESYTSYIEDTAFEGCDNLRVVKLYSINQIYYCAFNYCRKLTEVYLMGYLHTVEQYAFAQTPSATIYCSVSSARGWDSQWNYLSSGRVFWNVKALGETEDQYTYALLNDNTITLIGYHGEDTQLVLPSTVDSCPVTALQLYDVTVALNKVTSVVIPASVTTMKAEDLQGMTNATFYFEGEISNKEWNTGNRPIVENYAGENGETDGWYWAKNQDDTLTITGYKQSGKAEWTIPATLNGATVSTIAAYAFYDNDNLKVVYLPEGLTKIGWRAFYECGAMVAIFVPDTVMTAELAALPYNSNGTLYCGANEKPSGWVGEYGRTKIVWGSKDYGTTENGLVWAQTGADTACIAYYNGTETVLNIPETVGAFAVTEIAKYALKGQSALTELAIPECVVTIGECAIDDCSNLTVYAEASSAPAGWDSRWNIDSRPVVYNYGGAKGDESGLQWVKMKGDTVSIIGYNGSESALVIPETINGYTVTEIADSAFRDNAVIASVEFPQTLLKIGGYAFYGCYNIIELYIPASVETIGQYAFASNLSTGATKNRLQGVIFEDNSKLTETGWALFYGCTALVGVTLPEGMLTISSYTFYQCYNLESVVVPQSVKEIESFAFWDCGKLYELYLPGVTEIDDDFERCNKLVIYCAQNGSGTLSKVPLIWNCVGFGKMAADFAYAKTKDGQIVITAYRGNATEIVIPAYLAGEMITKIAPAAFYEKYSLKKVTIPASILSVGKNAFYGYTGTIYAEVAVKPSAWSSEWNPSSRPVEWGYNNITTNADYDYTVHDNKAFLTKFKGSCTSQFAIPATIDGNTVVLVGEFFRANTAIKYLTIPQTVTHIASYAFYECSNLNGVFIPASVEYIGVYAFTRTGARFYCEAEAKPRGWDGWWNYSNPAYTTIYGVQAAGVTEDGLLWYQINDEVHIYGYLGSAAELILPDSINEKPVRYIDERAFQSKTSLRKVVVSRSVKEIGYGAFRDNTRLEQVYIPNSVEVMGGRSGNVFYNCKKATIYMELASAPSNWSSVWLPDEEHVNAVVWGFDMSAIYGE